MGHLSKEVESAMKVLTDLSSIARRTGDHDLMYAANRAWREIDAYERQAAKASPPHPPHGAA